MRQVTLVFPLLPYSELLPNNLRREHWTVRSDVEKTAREEAALQARKLVKGPPFRRFDVDIIFTVSNRRSRDYDGLISAVKPWLDGLTPPKVVKKGMGHYTVAGANLIEDDDIWHIRRFTVSVNPEVCSEEETRIIITEVEDASSPALSGSSDRHP